MSNKITIELCAEDRARLDRLTAALETRCVQAEKALATIAEECQPDPEQDEIQQKLAETLAKAETPAEAPKTPTEATEAAAPPVTQPEEEKPTAKEDAPTEPVKPTVTLEQIQQKVVQLVAGNGGAKKAKVRAIISAYGAKVSDLKDQPDKWTEVWDKLTALESEG